MSVHLLLNQLHTIHPISIAFRNELTFFLKEVDKEKAHPFLRIGQLATWACMLVSGYIKGSVIDKDGNEVVIRFYDPLSFVTDLESFYNCVNSEMDLTAITDCKVQFLEKSDYVKLEKYGETEKLKSHIILREKVLADKRNLMLRLKPKQRFAVFVKDYPFFNVLPNYDCASFLNMGIWEYCRLKAHYLRNS